MPDILHPARGYPEELRQFFSPTLYFDIDGRNNGAVSTWSLRLRHKGRLPDGTAPGVGKDV